MPLAWAPTENDALMPTAEAIGSKTPEARFQIAPSRLSHACGRCRPIPGRWENGVVLSVSGEVSQNRVLGGLAASCQIALAERIDSGVLRVWPPRRRSFNHYAYSTPTSVQYNCRRLSDRAIGYGISGRTIDGTAIVEKVTGVKVVSFSPFSGRLISVKSGKHLLVIATRIVKQLVEGLRIDAPPLPLG